MCVDKVKGVMQLEFEKVYELYFKDIYRYIYSKSGNESISEEITQETFYKALKKINDFDDEKEDIRRWLFVVAKNAYYSYCRKHNKVISEKDLNDVPDDVNFVDKLVEKDTARQIQNFVNQMNDIYREVFTLRIYGELSFETIGQIFGKSDVWARVTYYRAKNKIAEYMEGLEHE